MIYLQIDIQELRKTIISIDSSDRDKIIDPYPNNFTIYLNKEFNNIYKIELIDINIINSMPPINNSNNYIGWIYIPKYAINDIINSRDYYIVPFINTYRILNENIPEGDLLFANKPYHIYDNF